MEWQTFWQIGLLMAEGGILVMLWIGAWSGTGKK